MRSRRPRPSRETRSAKPKREPYDLILIVCEGEKTEPNYFRDLIAELRLSTANVEIAGEQCGSSPATVVQYAVDRFQATGGYDRVFCVFDRDIHPGFAAARDRCHAIRRKFGDKAVQFESITSNPCFEYWLILHLRDTRKPYRAAGRKSAGDLALEDLLVLLPQYRKGASIYASLRDGIDNAISRARRGRQEGLDNPSTEVDILVEYLRQVKGTA